MSSSKTGIHKVLDKGEIEVMDVMGSDLTIVNCARVSFGKRKTEFGDDDRRLLRYLLRHHHTSPFRHVFLQFRIKAPEFVLRQWYKHVVGAEWISCHPSQLHGWNEISGRYIEMNEFYIPDTWRAQSKSAKQGSGDDLDFIEQLESSAIYNGALDHIKQAYRELVDGKNVAKEMARCLLPLSIYTEVIWTASLQAVLHFIDLRKSPDTQHELRVYAEVIDLIVASAFPETYEAWHSNPIISTKQMV